MRSRWAAAVVLLASMLLLHLCAPALAADRPPAAHPAAAQYDEPADAAREGAERPCPGEGDASLHRPLARSPRAAGPAAAHPPATGTATQATAPRRSAHHPRPGGPPPGRGPGGSAPGTTALQTFRC
ncbi:hypothetical protein ACFV2D_14450 [Streptomyces capillispiralis]|uniref:hypothetical protein n=1 Tax=Streptomyces capillispiralis TaxID=68182 RepID=UPI0036CC174E